ncbi:MAG: hypothetical protein V3W14_06660 [Candidatus Neomarinimicrobiota bacterium]
MHSRQVLPFLFIFAIVWLQFTGCQRTGATEVLTVKMIVTGNVGGEIEPCG